MKGQKHMSKMVDEKLADFGKRLAELRKNAGYTQQELADELGVSRRVIGYYESESQHPPASLLVDLCQVLDISSDELLGLKAIKQKSLPDSRLLRCYFPLSHHSIRSFSANLAS